MTKEIPIPKGLNPMSTEGFKKIFIIDGYMWGIKSYHISNNILIIEKWQKAI